MKKIYLHLFVIILVSGCVNTAFAVDWKKKSVAFSGEGRGSAASFVIKDKAYVGTGYYNNVFFKDFWQYDSDKETWTKIADFPGEARYEAVSFSANGRGYVGLGWGGSSGSLKDFYEYNPDNNTWTKIADFPDARSGAAVFVINDVGYIGTGYDTSLKSDFYKYESGQWKAIASLPADQARNQATAYTLNGKAYIVSGGAGPGALGGTDSMWEYNPATNTWQSAGRFNLISNMLHSYVSDNIPYVVLYNDLYKYDSVNERFSKIGSVFSDMTDISGETFFVIRNVPYMAFGTYGGFFDSKTNKDLWYDADAIKDTGIESLHIADFEVYPNPVSEYFVVSGMSGAQISILDLTGQLLLTRSNISDKETVSVSGWQQGVYLLIMKKEKNNIVKKLIINH